MTLTNSVGIWLIMFRYIAPVFKAPKMMPARMMPNGESLASAATEMPLKPYPGEKPLMKRLPTL